MDSTSKIPIESPDTTDEPVAKRQKISDSDEPKKILSADQASKAASALKNLMSKLRGSENLVTEEVGEKKVDKGQPCLSTSEAQKAATALKNIMLKLETKNSAMESVGENLPTTQNADKKIAAPASTKKPETNVTGGKQLSTEEATKAANALKNFMLKLQTKTEPTVKNVKITPQKDMAQKVSPNSKVLSPEEANKAAMALKNLMCKFRPKNEPIAEENSGINVAKNSAPRKNDAVEKNADEKNFRKAANIEIAIAKVEKMDTTNDQEEKNIDEKTLINGDGPEKSAGEAEARMTLSKDTGASENEILSHKELVSLNNSENQAIIFPEVTNENDDVTVIEEIPPKIRIHNSMSFKHVLNVLKSTLLKMEEFEPLVKSQKEQFTQEQFDTLLDCLKFWRTNGYYFRNLLQFFHEELKIGDETFGKFYVTSVESWSKGLQSKLTSIQEILKNVQKASDDNANLENSVVEIPTTHQIDSNSVTKMEEDLDACLYLAKSIMERCIMIGFPINIGDQLSRQNGALKQNADQLCNKVSILNEYLLGKKRECHTLQVKVKDLNGEIYTLKKEIGRLKQAQSDQSVTQKADTPINTSPSEKPNFKFCLPTTTENIEKPANLKIPNSIVKKMLKNRARKQKWKKKSQNSLNCEQSKVAVPTYYISMAAQLWKASLNRAIPQLDNECDPEKYFPHTAALHTVRDPTDPLFLHVFLNPANGQFDDIAYGIVILEYEKFNTDFKKKEVYAWSKKIKSSLSIKWEKIRTFLLETYQKWRSLGYKLERCQTFLAMLCSLVHLETIQLVKSPDITAMVVERAGRTTCNVLLSSRQIEVMATDRDPLTHMPVQAVVDKAREIVGNVSNGFLIDLMLKQ